MKMWIMIIGLGTCKIRVGVSDMADFLDIGDADAEQTVSVVFLGDMCNDVIVFNSFSSESTEDKRCPKAVTSSNEPGTKILQTNGVELE